MNEIYVQIGENKYPIALDAIIQRQDPMDRSWTNWHHIIVSNFTVSGDMTEYGKQVFHEYLANGKCQVTVYTGRRMPVRIASRRKPMRNTRIQRVQAKRKALDLSQDGKCCGLRTRKASYALRQAEERWYQDMTAKQPHKRDYEHTTARMRRKEKKRALKWKPLDYDTWLLSLSDKDKAYMEEASEQIALVSDDSQWNVLHNLMGVCWAYAREASNEV